MTSHVPVDYRNYVQSFRVSAPHAKPLAKQLAHALPEDHDEAERSALADIEHAADDVSEILSARDRHSPVRVRPYLGALGTHWGAVQSALDAVSHVPLALSDRGVRAAKLGATLFPDGVSFVRLDALAAWSEAQRRLDRIEDEDLREELEELVGADVVRAAEVSTAALGEILGVGDAAPSAPLSTDLRGKLLELSRRIAAYCRLLAAKVDEEDAASVERFRSAVAPLDEYRAAHPRRSGEDALEEEDEPEVPSGPAIDPEPAGA